MLKLDFSRLLFVRSSPFLKQEGVTPSTSPSVFTINGDSDVFAARTPYGAVTPDSAVTPDCTKAGVIAVAPNRTVAPDCAVAPHCGVAPYCRISPHRRVSPQGGRIGNKIDG